MSRARELSRLGNINVLSGDDVNSEVGIASTVPRSTLDVRGELQVGTGIQVGPAGVITATSFDGALGGNIVAAACTFTTGTFNGNVTIGGTLTYEDVTNVDALGIVTARAGVNVSGGQLLVGSGVTIGNAGVATFSGTSDVHLLDNVRLNVGDALDLTAYHDGSNSKITHTGAGGLYIGADTFALQNGTHDENYIVMSDNGSVDLYYDNVKVFNTDANGIMVKGPEGGTANVYIYADEGDDNSDKFQLTASDGGPFIIGNRASGSVETNIECNGNGNVELYYDNSKKFETTNDGTVTTGIVTATKLILNESGAFNDADEYLLVKNTDGACNLSIVANNTDHSSLNMGDEDDFNVGKIRYQHTDNAMCFFTSDAEKARISGVGSFGLGTATPKSIMEIVGANPVLTIRDTETSQGSANARLRLAETGSSDALDNYWDVAIDGQELKIIEGNLSTSTADTRLTISTSGEATFASTVSDSKGDLRRIIYENKTGSHTLVVGDAGKAIHISTGGVTIDNSIFSAGDAVTIVNNSGSSQTITQGSGVTLYNTDDASTGNKTLKARGIATVWFSSASIGYITGNFE